ncbi:hypothetical protein HK405_007731, partial [Cladochytrium tenue]
MSQLMDTLARIEADLDTESPVTGDAVMFRGASGTAADAMAKQEAEAARDAFEQATAWCTAFLEALCGALRLSLYTPLHVIATSTAASGVVTAAVVGLVALPEIAVAAAAAAGVGAALIAGAAVGAGSWARRVVLRLDWVKQMDDYYTVVLGELVRLIGVPGAAELELRNAYAHEEAIEQHIERQGFGPPPTTDAEADASPLLDMRFWRNWQNRKDPKAGGKDEGEPGSDFDDPAPADPGPLFNKELFGPKGDYETVVEDDLKAVVHRLAMVRQIHK